MLSKALEWASVFIGFSLLGNMEGHSFLRAFEINRYTKRYVKMLCKRVSVSIRGPLTNLQGIRLPRLLLDPEDIKILSLGAIWNFGKRPGLS
jgi:hypothetical protein